MIKHTVSVLKWRAKNTDKWKAIRATAYQKVKQWRQISTEFRHILMADQIVWTETRGRHKKE